MVAYGKDPEGYGIITEDMSQIASKDGATTDSITTNEKKQSLSSLSVIASLPTGHVQISQIGTFSVVDLLGKGDILYD